MSDNLTKTLVSGISVRNPNHDMSLAPAQIKTEPEDAFSNLNENQREYNCYNLNEQEQMKAEQMVCVSEDRMLPVKPELLLYLDHEVKQEMVIGPTVVEQVISGFAHQNGSLSSESRSVTAYVQEELQCALCGHWCLSNKELKCHKQSHDTPYTPTEVTAIKDKFQSLNADLRNQTYENPLNPPNSSIMCKQQSTADLQHHKQTPNNLPNKSTLTEEQQSLSAAHEDPEILSTTLVTEELQREENNQCQEWSKSLMRCQVMLRDVQELQCTYCGLFSLSVSDLKCHKKTHDTPDILTAIEGKHQTLTADKNNYKQTNKMTNFLTKTTPMEKQRNIPSKAAIKDQLQSKKIIHDTPKILPETKAVTDYLQSLQTDKQHNKHNKLLLRCTVKLQDARELKCTLCDRWCLSTRDLKLHKQTHSSDILTKNKTVNNKLETSTTE